MQPHLAFRCKWLIGEYTQRANNTGAEKVYAHAHTPTRDLLGHVCILYEITLKLDRNNLLSDLLNTNPPSNSQ